MRGRRDINKAVLPCYLAALQILTHNLHLIQSWISLRTLSKKPHANTKQLNLYGSNERRASVKHYVAFRGTSSTSIHVVADMWSTCLEFMEDPKTAFWACAWETLVSVCVCRHPPLHTNTLNKKGIHFLLILSLSYLGHHILARLSIISLQCPGRGWSEISVCVRCSTVHHVLKYDFNSFSFAMLLLIFFGGEGKHPPHSLRGLDWRSHMSTY